MCGILGILSNKPVAQDLYDGLTILQHRGQDAAGIVTYDGNAFHLKKDVGLVKEIFNPNNMMRLQGNTGIGHVRYPTIGGVGIENAQPFYFDLPYGITMAQNGNCYNFYDLKEEVYKEDLCQVNSECDIEAILHIFRSSLIKQAHKNKNEFEFVKNPYFPTFGFGKRDCMGRVVAEKELMLVFGNLLRKYRFVAPTNGLKIQKVLEATYRVDPEVGVRVELRQM